MNRIRRLQGMDDLAGPEWLAMSNAREQLGSLFGFYGYAPLETPVLEEADLFLRKMGGEMAVRMYTFTDPGGNHVALRPEFTASVVRRYLEAGNAVPQPWRVRYCGPVFRYESETEWRQFTQAGVELIGPAGPQADAEILQLAYAALKTLGVSDVAITVGDAGVYHSVIGQLGLSDRARSFVLRSIGLLGKGDTGLAKVKKEAERLHLLRGAKGEDVSGLPDLDEDTYRIVLRHFLTQGSGGVFGQRTPQEIEQRLLNKLRGDRPERMVKALEVANLLAGIKGRPDKALDEARRILKRSGLQAETLDNLQAGLGLAVESGVPEGALTLDLGLARGIAYYTGFVFEVASQARGTVLGGGGRYDSLIRELGYSNDVPALGFALTLESIVKEAQSVGSTSNADKPVLVVPADRGASIAAIRKAQALRDKGFAVEMELLERSKAERSAYARMKGIERIVIVDSTGQSTETDSEGGPLC